MITNVSERLEKLPTDSKRIKNVLVLTISVDSLALSLQKFGLQDQLKGSNFFIDLTYFQMKSVCHFLATALRSGDLGIPY